MKSMRLAAYVILGHLGVISYLIFTSTTSTPIPPKKVAVRTITLREKIPPKVNSLPIQPQTSQLSSQPSSQPAKEVKKATPQPTTKKTPQAKTPTPTKKVVSPTNAALAAKLKANLNELEKNSRSKHEEKNKSESLAVDALTDFTESSYHDEVALYIKHYLTLPEKGEARVSLTLTREGRVENLQIANCDNEKNRTFIEKELKKLLFPPFGVFFRGESRHTFSVNLNSR